MEPIQVYQTTLANEESYIFVSNIKVPTPSFGSANLLERIKRFVNFEYTLDTVPYFEITASYTLVHAGSGAVRKWVGSFSPQQNFSLTPVTPFRENFDPAFEQLLNLPYLTRQLGNLLPNTSWSLHEVESLIVNVSAIVPPTYPKLLARGLVNQYGRRGKRKIKTFNLP